MLVMPRGVITGGDGNTQGFAERRAHRRSTTSTPSRRRRPQRLRDQQPDRGSGRAVRRAVHGRRHGDRHQRRPARRAHGARARHQPVSPDNLTTWRTRRTRSSPNLALARRDVRATWSLPLTIAGNPREPGYARTFGNTGTERPTTARPIQRIETFGTTDQTPTTNVTGPGTPASARPRRSPITGTRIGRRRRATPSPCRSATRAPLPPGQRHRRRLPTTPSGWIPDVVGATSATWSWEVTVSYEGVGSTGAVVVDTAGQADLRRRRRRLDRERHRGPPVGDIAHHRRDDSRR